MLRAARAQGKAVQLPDIMHSGIAQHGARLREIRMLGFVFATRLDVLLMARFCPGTGSNTILKWKAADASNCAM